MTSAFALATPQATVPMPTEETSFTETPAFSFTAWRSWMSWARSCHHGFIIKELEGKVGNGVKDEIMQKPKQCRAKSSIEREIVSYLDGVNVVVRRRTDQGHARLARPQPGNVLRDLGSGKLPSLSRLGTLGHLNLGLLSRDEEFWRDAEPTRGDLVNERVRRITVLESSQVREGGGASLLVDILNVLSTDNILSTLARVGFTSDTIHGNGQGLMRLAGKSSKGHGAGAESFHDLRSIFHLLQSDRLPIGFEI
mmetsp:Transcript_33277/g.99020  ORF Transcript_33277/g.99020 Transcript_33277/m.99020 type:complete len:253 (-) Transcript_33277:3220-3978(-)